MKNKINIHGIWVCKIASGNLRDTGLLNIALTSNLVES